MSNIVLSNSVQTIGQSIFQFCNSLTSINIPNNITSIGNSAFQGCTSLTNIVIPNNVTSIAQYAFASCNVLSIVVLSNSVTSISQNTFLNCNILSSVTFNGNIPTISSGNFGLQGSTAYYYGYAANQQNFQGLFTNYVMLPFSYTYQNIIYNFLDSNNVSIIGFDNPPINWNLFISSTVTYNSSTYNSSTYNVVSISSNAFQNCYNLTSITIPNSVTSIGTGSFVNCISLTNINIPTSVTSIQPNTFQGSSGLINIIIPSSIISIGTNAFQSCYSLKKVTFNGNTPTISSGNFTIIGDTSYYYNGALNTNILSSFFTYVQCIDCPPPEKPCVWKCNKNKWDKFKFTSSGNNPNISYKQQISIQINTTVGGNVHYGNYYLGKPVQVNYLGRTEGQPGGSGAPLRNKF